MNNPNSVGSSLWTKDFILTSLSNLFLFFSFHLLTPILPIYIVEMGGDKFAAGMVVGIFTISALVIRPFAGGALDMFDRKKVLYLGLFIFILTVISYEWMYIVSFILFARMIQGIGWGVATTTYATMVSDYIPSSRRAEGMGYFGLSINVGMALGPLIGIWLMVEYGFTMVFIIAAVSILLSILLSHYILYPQKPIKKSGSEKVSIIEKNALLPAILVMMMTLAHGGILSSLTLFGKETGISDVGWFFLASALSMMVSRPTAGKIADKIGQNYVLVPGALALGLGLLILSYSSNVFVLMIAAIFYGTGYGGIQPTLQAWVITRVSPDRRGAATATYFSAFDLGIGTGA
ncbi:MAG: transporter, partial [Neobacillus sp.]|nr:transporter [Neobacillus sp.]